MVKHFSPIIIILAATLLIPVSCGEENLTKPEKETPAADAAGNSASDIGILSNHPDVLVPNLDVRTVISGLLTPIAVAFIGDNDMLVLEKNTGKVLRVTDGQVQGTALDLAVNNASERGLLGIALHPNFPDNPGVYLYWTESTSGADSNTLSDTPLLGNRVDRFNWNENTATLTMERNLIRLRALQEDAGQPARGNHDGGVLKFGPDGKLYIFIGDVGRRGQLQNLPCGPTPDCPGATVPDDQFGGPPAGQRAPHRCHPPT